MNPISIDNVFEKFNAHYLLESNDRILFSGKYGIGKTYFLKKFFEIKEENTNYIIISPVNYSVKENDDIFNLIKADILFSLFEKNLIEFKGNISIDFFNLLYYYIGNPLKLANSLLQLGSSIDSFGEDFSKQVKTTEKIVSFIQDNYKGLKKNIEEKLNKNNDELEEFWKTITSSPSTIYEDNLINQFINETLSKASLKGTNVLVIDDLDRMDPEHIFRILNIFSVHNNHLHASNKFNFDKIILVCDIENIQKIFHHKYGEGVDFEGYIDKFYSIDIFNYSNNDAIAFYFAKGLKTDLKPASEKFLKFILNCALKSKEINLRQLLKHLHFENIGFEYFVIHILNIKKDDLYTPLFKGNEADVSFRSYSLDLLNIFYNLKTIWGSFQILETKLERILKYIEKNSESLSFEELVEFVEPLIWFNHMRATGFSQEFYFTKGPNRVHAYPKGIYQNLPYEITLKWKIDYADTSKSILYQPPSYYFEDSSVTYSQKLEGYILEFSILKDTIAFLNMIKQDKRFESYMKLF